MWLLIYVFLFLGVQWIIDWAQLGMSSYLVEAALAGLVLILLHLKCRPLYFRLWPANGTHYHRCVYDMLSMLIVGFIIGQIAVYFFVLPFQLTWDWTGLELLLLLLLVGPILEELLLRFLPLQIARCHSKLSRWIDQYPQAVAWLFGLIFALVHLKAFYLVPYPVRPFILFQSTYTLFLGYVWTRLLLKSKALFHPLLAHMGVNLGFSLALLIHL